MTLLSQARVFVKAGVPTSGDDGTEASRVAVGDLLIDTTNRRLYVATAVTAGSGFTGAGAPTYLGSTAPSVTWSALDVS